MKGVESSAPLRELKVSHAPLDEEKLINSKKDRVLFEKDLLSVTSPKDVKEEAKKVVSRNAKRPNGARDKTVNDQQSSHFSLFEDDSSCSAAKPKFEFERQMLLQVQLRESVPD